VAGTLSAQTYIQPCSPRKTPTGTLMMTEATSGLNDFRRHYWEAGRKEGERP
jgi:hypothetical protein